MNRTIFDGIVEGKMKSWKVWEDEKFLAFLTPFPNTPGFTVVIPKVNPGDYVFAIDDGLYGEFNETYKGWLTTAEGPKMDDARLDEIQAKIVAAGR